MHRFLLLTKYIFYQPHCRYKIKEIGSFGYFSFTSLFSYLPFYSHSKSYQVTICTKRGQITGEERQDISQPTLHRSGSLEDCLLNPLDLILIVEMTLDIRGWNKALWIVMFADSCPPISLVLFKDKHFFSLSHSHRTFIASWIYKCSNKIISLKIVCQFKQYLP